jgi:hypothetical protein
MAHFAKVENGVVREVLVIGNDDCLDVNGVESEAVGQAFIASIGLSGEWKQTSYNANFRGKYAGIGMSYDADLDEFVTPPSDDDASA